MSKKHVEDYYLRMLSDYSEMRNVLEQLQKSISEDPSSVNMEYINTVKEKVKVLEANYKRLSYIMFLLNMPNKKDKIERYKKREHKKLDEIPIKDRRDNIEKENSNTIDTIKSAL